MNKIKKQIKNHSTKKSMMAALSLLIGLFFLLALQGCPTPSPVVGGTDVETATAALTGSSVVGVGDTYPNVTGDLTLPTSGANGVAISWTSSVPSVIATTGVVTRSNEMVPVLLTATLTKGSDSATKAFNVTVFADANLPVQNVTLPTDIASALLITSFENLLALSNAGWTTSMRFGLNPNVWLGNGNVGARVGARAITSCELETAGDCGGTTGTVTSPNLVVTKNYLNFLLSGTDHPAIKVTINNVTDGTVVETVSPSDATPDYIDNDGDWMSVDLTAVNGKTINIVIEDDSTTGFISFDHFFMSDAAWNPLVFNSDVVTSGAGRIFADDAASASVGVVALSATDTVFKNSEGGADALNLNFTNDSGAGAGGSDEYLVVSESTADSAGVWGVIGWTFDGTFNVTGGSVSMYVRSAEAAVTTIALKVEGPAATGSPEVTKTFTADGTWQKVTWTATELAGAANLAALANIVIVFNPALGSTTGQLEIGIDEVQFE